MTKISAFALGVAAALLMIQHGAARQLPRASVQIDRDDIGGVVTGSAGPEAGVWVIAETTDLPFEEWTKAERQARPPIVLRVQGTDLHAGGLERFLDGGQHIVLIVEGPSSPAPLARLVTPGTLVLQTNDEFGLEEFANATGPAIAAIVPDTAARFLHDPGAGG
jgi:hypothetical protein